uniref:Uncharacterized protein n=1 Tax=Pristionchus pacificus TaxID=54126 RepID=A0A2A6C5A2_PRIPA|eukprot:PDM73278.1 hypothetical protein PRIPAC_40634 [Pristionchus pacificus]
MNEHLPHDTPHRGRNAAPHERTTLLLKVKDISIMRISDYRLHMNVVKSTVIFGRKEVDAKKWKEAKKSLPESGHVQVAIFAGESRDFGLLSIDNGTELSELLSEDTGMDKN